MGLGLSLAGTFFITSGLKDVVGKPRPDLLARCDPDLSNIGAHLVGGLGLMFEEAPVLVATSICRQTDMSILNDGFASFPSGHSSFSWAGLLYLSLWLSAKFAITIPFLAPAPHASDHSHNQPSRASQSIPPRSQAAAPPLYLLLLVATPIATALYVCASRWADYQHQGFDIIAGSILGALFAWTSFRWYHLPLRRGAGWAWGARSRDRAFYAGMGVPGFVGGEGWESAAGRRDRYEDLELGNMGGRGVGDGLAGTRSDHSQ
jgi:membrane-associated phospholipid phosphatase